MVDIAMSQKTRQTIVNIHNFTKYRTKFEFFSNKLDKNLQ